MKNLSIKVVTDEQELKSAMEIRRQVFIIEQGVPHDLEMDEYDAEALHIIAYYHGNIIATCRLIFLPDEHVKLERMAILKPFRNKGIGRKILDYIDRKMEDKQIKLIVIHAQSQAIPFYESFGFKRVGLPFWEAGIEHIKMQKHVDEF
jgi:predicted GNAT family N-acyltransferase